jgi:hypothetical protein
MMTLSILGLCRHVGSNFPGASNIQWRCGCRAMIQTATNRVMEKDYCKRHWAQLNARGKR